MNRNIYSQNKLDISIKKNYNLNEKIMTPNNYVHKSYCLTKRNYKYDTQLCDKNHSFWALMFLTHVWIMTT